VPVAATPTPTPAPVVQTAAAPDKITLTATAAKGRKLTLTGKLTLPQGFACPSAGTVSVSVSLGKKVVKKATAKLDGNCGYTVSLALPKSASGRKVTVKARFLTAGSLLARSAPARTITVKR
jgi:transcription elongation factor Elf1